MLEGSQLFHRGLEEEGIHGSSANFHKTSMDARVFLEFSNFFWAVHQDPLQFPGGVHAFSVDFPMLL